MRNFGEFSTNKIEFFQIFNKFNENFKMFVKISSRFWSDYKKFQRTLRLLRRNFRDFWKIYWNLFVNLKKLYLTKESGNILRNWKISWKFWRILKIFNFLKMPIKYHVSFEKIKSCTGFILGVKNKCLRGFSSVPQTVPSASFPTARA